MCPLKTDSNMRCSIIFLFASAPFLLLGCGTKLNPERKYDKENFFGSWTARSAIITNPSHIGEEIGISVPRYGQINCQINPDNTFTLDVNVTRDVVLKDSQSWLSTGRVPLHGGYKMFIRGTYELKDSIADFYNYNRKKHFRSLLYTYGDYFYLTYTDERQNEWKLQLEKAN